MGMHIATLRSMHKEAKRLAFALYLRKGRVPPRITEILHATASPEAFEEYCKFNPDQPRAPAGTPEGGQWIDAGGGGTRKPSRDGKYPKSAIKTYADAENIVRKYEGTHVGKTAHCASLTRELSPELPSTPKWKRGERVRGNEEIPVGTPIATFNFFGKPNTNGYGPATDQTGITGHSHTGIYLGQSEQGLVVLHQYQGSNGPKIQSLPWGAWGRYREEGGMRYYTIDY